MYDLMSHTHRFTSYAFRVNKVALFAVIRIEY